MMDDDRYAILAEARAHVERHRREMRAAVIADARDLVAGWQPPEQEPPPTAAPKLDTPRAAEPDWSGWEAWLAARLKTERAFVLECVGMALGEAWRAQRADARRELASEVRSLRLELAEANEVIGELRRTIAASGPAAEIIDLPARRGVN